MQPVQGSAAIHGDGVESQLLDYGSFYASKTFDDRPRNQRVMFGWLPEEFPQAAPNTTINWQGALSLPLVISTDPRNSSRLVSVPVVGIVVSKHH